VTTFIKQELVLCDLNYKFRSQCILIKPVLSDHMSYVTIFHCSLERSHKTGLIVFLILCIKYSSGLLIIFALNIKKIIKKI